jgi:hypothetical protein
VHSLFASVNSAVSELLTAHGQEIQTKKMVSDIVVPFFLQTCDARKENYSYKILIVVRILFLDFFTLYIFSNEAILYE